MHAVLLTLALLTQPAGNDVWEMMQDLQEVGIREEQAEKIAGVCVAWMRRIEGQVSNMPSQEIAPDATVWEEMLDTLKKIFSLLCFGFMAIVGMLILMLFSK